MRILLTMLLALGATAMTACSSDKNYEIEDDNNVTLDIKGMT
ncbi:MAG: hypothetical protein VYE81_10970 [Planctomycetota bacterium]|nr:hypothetical protein [Planctomycetota bacterium]